jgi:N-acyl-L-homoserine lactone synthetase
MEFDEFDADYAEYALILDTNGEVLGGFRATCTLHPYLTERHFGHLAILRQCPKRADAYEISRFGVLPGTDALSLGLLNYALLLEFARRRRANSLIALSDLRHERLLRTIGIRTRRYGPPGVVGQDIDGRDIVAVVGEISMTDQLPEVTSKLKSILEHVEIIDETSFRRHSDLQA